MQNHVEIILDDLDGKSDVLILGDWMNRNGKNYHDYITGRDFDWQVMS